MKIKALFMQRKESYPEQYAPELLVAVDEFCYEENPSYFEDQCETERQSASSQAAAFLVVNIEVDGDEIRRLLLGAPSVEGKLSP